MSSAYLLLFHGSLDPRPQASVERLAELVSQSQALAKAMQVPMVGTAALELASVPLHQQIAAFAVRALTSGYDTIQLIPLFLLPGVHVMEDIPREVTLAQQVIGEVGKIELRPYLGNNSRLAHLLAIQIAAIKAEVWILLAHGSRRAGSKQQVEAMATRLGATTAYWAIQPGLASRVQELFNAGYRQIGILPYFLFPGGITDAIATSVAQLKKQFPTTDLHLAEPLGANLQLADLIGDLLQ